MLMSEKSQLLEISDETEIITSSSSSDVLQIETVQYDNINYSYFYSKFLLRNLPCIIKNVSLSWQCNEHWIKNDEINFEYLTHEFGEIKAPVADCNNIAFNAQCKTEMSVNDYVAYLKLKNESNILYLKDWHLRRERPDTHFYIVPFMFASDWLNEFCLDNNEDDFMFVYIGPKKSWTPFHVDVYNSFSWSVNVTGIKKWILFPPKEELKLKDSFGNLPLLFNSSSNKDIQFFEIIQEKGDAIFVPSGWHHQVVNMADTISINHNWINACNLEMVTNSLLDNLSNVEHEISDLRDCAEFVSQCQLVLKADYGMNVPDYIKFLNYITDKRLKQLNGDEQMCFGMYKLGLNHIKFDLKMIMKSLKTINENPLFVNQFLETNVNNDINVLITKISQSL